MMTVKVKTKDRFAKIVTATQKRNIKTLGQAGAFVYSIMRRSIRKSKRASLPGQPPKTRRGALRNAIQFQVEANRERVLIGPVASIIGRGVGGAHEFGGDFRGRNYPARAFAGPAIIAAAPRLPKQWNGILRG